MIQEMLTIYGMKTSLYRDPKSSCAIQYWPNHSGSPQSSLCRTSNKLSNGFHSDLMKGRQQFYAHKFYGNVLPLTFLISQQTFRLMLKPSSVI